MVTTEEALAKVLQNIRTFGTEEKPLVSSVGAVLKEEIYADRDFPPFDRVSMDGIALCFESYTKGINSFPIQGIQAAGSPQLSLASPTQCIEVMTGAVCPKGCDLVIPYEKIRIENNKAHIEKDDYLQFKNIHKKGKDRIKGDSLLSKNTIIGPSEIGVLATVGKQFVKVSKTPKVLIVSTGDELVDIDETPKAHQIRKSNVYTLNSLLKKYNIDANLTHIKDDKSSLLQTIKKALSEYDVLLFSGGVSKGKYDYLPEVFEELSVTKHFHKVKQRPGKPFWFGTKAQTCIFAFPGNPVSTLVNALYYFVPWLEKSLSIKREMKFAILNEDVTFKPDLTYFMQAQLIHSSDGKVKAIPYLGNGSGDLANLVNIQIFLILPKGREVFNKGEIYPYLEI